MLCPINNQYENNFKNVHFGSTRNVQKVVVKALTEEQRQLIESNFKDIKKVVNYYCRRVGGFSNECFQEACLVVLRCAQKYNPEKGPFMGYVKKSIEDGMGNRVSLFPTVRISSFKTHQCLAMRAVKNEYFRAHGTFPGDEWIAKRLNYSMEELRSLQYMEASFSHMPSIYDKRLNKLTGKRERIVDTLAAAPEELLEAAELTLQEKVRRVLDLIAPRKRRFLEMRFGLDGNEPMSIREIAKATGVCSETVSTVLKKLLNYLHGQSEMREIAKERLSKLSSEPPQKYRLVKNKRTS